MSLTYSIDHVGVTTESVLVDVAPKSELTYVKTVTDIKTGEVSTWYVLSSGDDAYPANVIFRSSTQLRSGAQRRIISVSLNTWAVKADSVAAIDTREQCFATIAFNMPASMTIELADFQQFAGTVFSFLYPSVASGVRSTAYLAKLLFGASQVA